MTSAENRYVAIGFAGMAALMLVPLLSVAIPPLTDLPNHISRLYILVNIADDADLQRNYVESWTFIPNLAIDLVGLPLAKLISPYAAGKIFAILAFVTALLGMVSLHVAAHKSVNAWTGTLFFIVYNQCFMYGLVNFYFGVGLGFLLLAAWIRYGPKQWHIGLWLLPLGALAVYFSHLLAFGLYGLIFTGYELSRFLRRRERARSYIHRRSVGAGVQFILPLLLFVFTGKSGTQLEGVTEYVSPLHKLLMLLSGFHVYVEPIDLIAIVFLIVLFCVALWRKKVRIGVNLWIPLAFLTVLAIITPSAVLSIFGIDQRLAVVAAMFLFAAIRIELPLRGAVVTLLFFGTGLLIWRAVTLTHDWRAFDDRFAELRRASQVMERGASVLAVQRQTGERAGLGPLSSERTYWHAASLTVVERSLYNPLTFTARHQPIAAHPYRKAMDCDACLPLTLEALRITANPEVSSETLKIPHNKPHLYRFAAMWPDRFDYVLIMDFGAHENPMPELLAIRHTGSFFTIYENRQRPRS
jgi:hypothetical protein